MRARVGAGVQRLEQVVALARLAIVLAQLAVAVAAGDALSQRQPGGRAGHVDLLAAVLGGPNDGSRGQLRLVDAAGRLHLAAGLVAAPGRTRGVQRRQVDQRHVDVRMVVLELRPQRLGERADGLLGAPLRAVQLEAAVGAGRADLDDAAAVPRGHPPQGRHGAVHGAQVGDLGGPPELLRRDRPERRHDAGAGVVDPHVDRPEAVLDGGRGVVHRLRIGHVDGDDEARRRRPPRPPRARPPGRPRRARSAPPHRPGARTRPPQHGRRRPMPR